MLAKQDKRAIQNLVNRLECRWIREHIIDDEATILRHTLEKSPHSVMKVGNADREQGSLGIR